MGNRKMINADTRNVTPSTQSARNSRSTSREENALKPLSQAAAYASSANASDATGKVPKAAKRPSEFAEVSCFVSTRLGMDASFAGPHSNERISSANDTRTSPTRLSTNGSNARSPARPKSQATITRRRSKRSTITPPTVARKKPGTTRATITRLTAAPDPPDTRAAIARIAMIPIQSPRLDTTWATQSLKNERVPKTRQNAGGRPVSSGDAGMNGAGFSAIVGQVRWSVADRDRANLRPFGRDWRVLAAVSVVPSVGGRFHRGHDLARGCRRLLCPCAGAAGLLLRAAGLLLGAARLLLGRLTGARGGAASLALPQELDRLFEVHGLRVGAARDRRVQRPVGHVRAVSTVEDPHRRAGVGMLAQLGDGRLGPPAMLLGLREQGLGPLDGDGEDLVLGLEAAALLPLLQVRAVAAVVGGDLVAAGVGTHLAGQAKELERVLERDRVEAHRRQQRRRLRLLLAVDELAELHVRPVAAVARDHLETGLGVGAELLRSFGRPSQQLDGEVYGELVGRDVVREGRALLVALEVRAELSDPHVDRPALVVLADLDGVDLARVDLGEVLLAHELLEAALPVAVVEVVQPVLGLALTSRDPVELFFHRRGEVVVDEVREVPLHELELGERRP